MAQKKFYIGSVGPFYYEDTQLSQDPDFPNRPLSALLTDGQLQITTPPTAADEIARKQEVDMVFIPAIAVSDIDNPAAELAIKSGLDIGVLAVVYKSTTDVVDEFTIYCWDTSVISGTNVPYVLPGSGGWWVAVGGKYNNHHKTQQLAVVVDVRNNNGVIEKKTRTITFTGSMSSESNWE